MTEKCGEVVIRDAVPADAERIREIYDHYVRHTAISFEYETPTPEEMRERMHRTMARFPYLAAERDGVVQGYAYAGPFKERAAYDWCCEMSIYLAQDARKCGMGAASLRRHGGAAAGHGCAEPLRMHYLSGPGG